MKLRMTNSTMLEEIMVTLHSAELFRMHGHYALPATQLGQNAVVAGWFDGGFCTSRNPNWCLL